MPVNASSLKRTARWAGLLYLAWILTGLFGFFYVPSRINMRGDVVTTAQNILAHEALFRTSVMNDLVSGALWVLLGVVLYRLFKEVNEHHARLLVALVLVQIPVVFVMDAFSLTSLLLFKGEILKSLAPDQRQELAMLCLGINNAMTLALELFWGLWLLPLAILTYRSRFLPRFIGIWLAVNGLAYVVLCFVSILAPQFKNIATKIFYPAMMGEMVFMAWLVVVGARPRSTVGASELVAEPPTAR